MRKWLPLLAISLGSFMLLIDVTIVNVALPDVAGDLNTSFSSLQWVVDGYALTLAAVLMGVGALADLVGHRRVYLTGLGVFAAASLTCGLASDAGLLVGARLVQGVGAAAMFATTFALLNAGYTGKDRGVAYGIWGAVSGAAAAIGPILGGVLTEALSWQWIFYVNLPISVLAVALTLRAFGADTPDRTRRVDVGGTLTFTVFAAALTYGLIEASDGWTSTRVVAMLAVAAAALVAFVLVQRHSRNAMLDLALLRNRTFSGVLLAALAVNFAAFAALTYASIWLQSVQGLSPIEAGLTGVPISGAAFVVSALVGRKLHHVQPGPIIAGGLLLVGLGGVLDALLLSDGSSWPALIPGYVLAGLGVGLAIPTLSSSAMGAVPMSRAGMAAGAVNTARQLSFAIGIAVLGTVFTSRATSWLSGRGAPDATRTAHGVSGGQSPRILAAVPAGQRARVDDLLHGAAISGLQGAMLVAGLVGIVAAVAVFALVRPSRPSRPSQATAVEPEAERAAEPVA